MTDTLAAVLRTVARRGQLRHLLIVQRPDGRVQASYAPAGAATVSIREDPVLAVLEALSPPYGHSWAEVVGDRLAPRVEALTARLASAESDDDLSEDIL